MSGGSKLSVVSVDFFSLFCFGDKFGITGGPEILGSIRMMVLNHFLSLSVPIFPSQSVEEGGALLGVCFGDALDPEFVEQVC